MNYTLQNNLLTATIKSSGAELCSLKDHTGTEHIWTADSRYWGRHTPVLFPLVGKVLDNTYTHNGKDYSVGQHGFARDLDFEVTYQTPTAITFALTANDHTLTMYPFLFELRITYTLEGHTLAITYDVHNADKETIGFKIGAHPGFMCPVYDNETMEDYYFQFPEEETATSLALVDPGYFKTETSTWTGTTLPISPELFKDDALVFTNLKSSSIALRSKKRTSYLEVGFEGFPFLGLWSPHTPSPFVCIEPWFGHADYVDESREWMTKKDLVMLEPAKTFSCTHTMILHFA
ncbi:MAG: aldose 1-epimerase family protein [Cellulosilyticaceae bacterium]